MKKVYRPLNQQERFIVTEARPKWITTGPRQQKAYLDKETVRELGIDFMHLVEPVEVTSTWHKHHESMTLNYELGT
jgi:hypothetical protein